MSWLFGNFKQDLMGGGVSCTGGKCQNASTGAIHCLCSAGFSGRLCDDVIGPSNVTANASDVTAASALRRYVVVVCLGVLIPLVVIATTAVVWFVVWKLNRRRRRRTKSSPPGGSPPSGGGAAAAAAAEGDNIRNDLKSLNNYAQKVGYQVPGSLKITNLAAAAAAVEEGGVGGTSGKKVAAHAWEAAVPEVSSSSASSAAADRKLYGDLNFHPQTSSWTDKYEGSEKNVLSNKRDIEEEDEEGEEEGDIIYSIEKSLDRFSSLSTTFDNCHSSSQLNRNCG